jgi:hypothetical protein
VTNLRQSRRSAASSIDLASSVNVKSHERGAAAATDGMSAVPDGNGARWSVRARHKARLTGKKWSGSVGRILFAVAGETVIPLGRRLPDGSSHLPARSSGRSARSTGCPASRAYLMLLRMGFCLPLLSPAAR